MALNKFFSCIKSQTIHGGDQQFADKIQNDVTADVYIEGNVSGGNVAGRDIHITNNGISKDDLIELAEKLGVVKSERDEWIRKYQDLEQQLAKRSDETAQQAKAFLDKGDLEQAEKLFIQALANDLKNAAANAFSLAEIKVLQLNQAEAKTYYNQATQLDPDNASYWNELGKLLYRVGDLDEAITAYRKELCLGETHKNQREIAAAYGNSGLVYYTRGDLDKAIEFYQKALTLHEVKAEIAIVYGNLGLVYYTRGDLDKAIEFYQKALTLNEALCRKDGMAADYANLGNVYKQKGNKTEAKRYYQKSIELCKYIGSPNEKLVQGWLDAL